MKEYICIKLTANPDLQEILMAITDNPAIEVYEETPDALLCYLPKNLWTQELKNELETNLEPFSIIAEISEIPYTNWNKEWERNFNPIQVNDFVGIRADFHLELNNVRYDLVINPVMAFGTGHHETTYQMIEMMEDIPFKNKTVLDYGCGTGVLGILASKMGASSIEGNDITEESIINTKINCEINAVSNFKVFMGELDLFSGKLYDIILANINRNVLLESAGQLYNLLKPGGCLLISGYLPEDKDIIEKNFSQAGFYKHSFSQKGNWLCHKWFKQ